MIVPRPAVFALIAILLASPALAQTRVIDADTIDHDGTRYRLHGIDAPERDQTCINDNGQLWQCGEVAAIVLDAYLIHRNVECRTVDIDRYGRSVAKCTADGYDIGATLVRSGLAVAYRQYSDDYVAEERAAREERRGMWAGAFVMPWDWRHR